MNSNTQVLQKSFVTNGFTVNTGNQLSPQPVANLYSDVDLIVNEICRKYLNFENYEKIKSDTRINLLNSIKYSISSNNPNQFNQIMSGLPLIEATQRIRLMAYESFQAMKQAASAGHSTYMPAIPDHQRTFLAMPLKRAENGPLPKEKFVMAVLSGNHALHKKNIVFGSSEGGQKSIF